MYRTRFTLPGLVALAVSLTAATVAAQTPIAFVDVNVVPMDCDCVLAHQTVLVRGSSIARVGGVAEVPVPSGALVIRGGGSRYLVPGLADMHVHASDLEIYPLLLAAGVTTVLHLGDGSSHDIVQVRDAIRRRGMAAPTIYAAFRLEGPGGNGLIVTTPDEARSAVREAKAAGYEFVKVYNQLGADVLRAILDEGRRQGLGVVGHAVRSVPLSEALNGGQSAVVHAEEFLYTVLRRSESASDLNAAAGMMHAAHAYLIPNLSAYEVIAKQWGKSAVVDSILRQPYVRTLSPEVLDSWRRSDYVTRKGSLDGKLEILRRLTRLMQDSAVPLMTGTDTPDIPGMAPGFSLHEDLRTLVDAGLSNFEALSAATRTPGEFVRSIRPASPRFGVVRAGARADLVLVAKNPLQGLETLRTPEGVMAAGAWQTASQLSSAQDSLVRLFAEESRQRDALAALIGSRGGEVAVTTMDRPRGTPPFRLDFTLNHMAYDLIDRKDLPTAIRLFEWNVRLFPRSSNAFESLCEGYELAHDVTKAIAACQRALAIDPHNSDARNVAARLTNAPAR